MPIGRRALHDIVEGIKGIARLSIRLMDRDRAVRPGGIVRNGRLRFTRRIHREGRSRKGCARVFINLDDGQLMLHIRIGEGEIIAERELLIRVYRKLVAALRHSFAVLLVGNGHGSILIYGVRAFLGKGVLFDDAVSRKVLQFGSALAPGVEIDKAAGEIRIGMAFHIHPAAGGILRLLLQDKTNRVFLLVSQVIVAAEALGDIDTFSFRIAAHLQHIAVKIAENIAVLITWLIRDQEAVKSIILPIIDIFSVRDLIRRGDHFKEIDRILLNRQSVCPIIEFNGDGPVLAGRKRNLLALILPGQVIHRAHVRIQQAEFSAAESALHMAVRIREQINAVHAARTGDIRAGRRDGF